jgi:23S rRNA pseudouridine1911/1915/1917 synthase
MEMIYCDKDIVVCVKPPRVLSTDEPGGMPDLVREALGEPNADVRTVHRLDRVVSGLMVLARNAAAASELSRQIREGEFDKSYLAVLHGVPEEPEALLRDLLLRDKRERKTYVVTEPAKGVQEALLRYQLICAADGLSKVSIELLTGRTHQIRAQFSSRGLPLVGDRKYSTLEDDCEIALWSWKLSFNHPKTGVPMAFELEPPQDYPWNAV